MMQARYVTGVYRSKIKWRRQSPALTLSCASHTLRENVMEPNVDIKRLPPAQEKIKENQRNKPRVNRVTQSRYACDDGCLSMRNRTRKTKKKAGKHKTPPQTLSCASHTLREIVMELKVDTKRLPPAQETTRTRELKQNNWYAPQVQIVEFYNWLNAAIVEKRPIRSDQYSKNTNQN